MKIILSKMIREVQVISLDERIEYLFIRSGLRLTGAKTIYIESSDYDDVASQLLQQGFRFVASQGVDG